MPESDMRRRGRFRQPPKVQLIGCAGRFSSHRMDAYDESSHVAELHLQAPHTCRNGRHYPRLFQNVPHVAPFLGTWKEHFPKGLEWNLIAEWSEMGEVEACFGRFPTWSWFSRAYREVDFFCGEDSLFCIQLIRSDLGLVGEELVSDVKSSCLIANGFILEVIFTDSLESIAAKGVLVDVPNISSYNLRCYIDDKTSIPLRAQSRSRLCLLSDGFAFLVIEEGSGNPKRSQRCFKRIGWGSLFDVDGVHEIDKFQPWGEAEGVEKRMMDLTEILGREPLEIELI